MTDRGEDIAAPVCDDGISGEEIANFKRDESGEVIPNGLMRRGVVPFVFEIIWNRFKKWGTEFVSIHRV